MQVFNFDHEMLYYFKITIYKIKKKVYNKYINGSKIQFFKNSLKTQDLIEKQTKLNNFFKEVNQFYEIR